MSSDNSMPKYCSCEADVCHMIGSYMTKYYCEDLFSINVNRTNSDIEEESLEKHIMEKNTCIYDSNYIHILNVADTMNIDNMMESGIVVAFANIRNQLIMRIGRTESIIVSMNNVQYVHPSNSKLIITLDCS